MVATVVFLVTFAAAWVVPASLTAPSHVSMHGVAQSRVLPVAAGSSASFSWTIEAEIDDPRLVEIYTHIPMDHKPTRDAGRGANVWIELLVNGESAYRFRFGGTDASHVGFTRVPNPGANVDWSALREGTNVLTFYLNASLPEGSYPERGSVEISGGPATFEAWYADSDGDRVADVHQPARFLPTYVIAALLGIVVAGGCIALTRRVGRR